MRAGRKAGGDANVSIAMQAFDRRRGLARYGAAVEPLAPVARDRGGIARCQLM